MILLVHNFFPKPLVKKFLLTNNAVRFSSSIIRLEIYFFSEGIFFASYFLGRIFFPQNQSTGYFF